MFGLRVEDYSNIFIYRKDKERTAVNLSIHKVHCCYFDEGNLQIIDVKNLKIARGS